MSKKLLPITVIVSCIVLGTGTLVIAGKPNVDLDAVGEQVRLLCDVQDPANVEESLKKLSMSLLQDLEPADYLAASSKIFNEIARTPMGKTPEGMKIRVELAKAVITEDFGDRLTPGLAKRQVDIFFEMFSEKESPNQLSQSDRSNRMAILLLLWNRLQSFQREYSQFDPYHPGPKWRLEPYQPPRSYKGPFIFGMSPDAITDVVVRAEYSEYLRRREEFNEGSRTRDVVKGMSKRFSKRASKLINQWYEGEPDWNEIEKLIDDNIKSSSEATSLKELVRKAFDKHS